MPFPFFGFGQSDPAAAKLAAAAGATHHRQSSLSLSSSDKNARLADVRARVSALVCWLSYLYKRSGPYSLLNTYCGQLM
eukprot:scaffold13499_cov207-Alexandrium_tamarense.AAC.1